MAGLDADALAAGEKATFFNLSRETPVECLSACFRRHVYAPHTHDTFVVGTITAGCETFLIGGVRHYAGPGDLCLIDPGVVHDGAPVGEGYAYRISYPTADFLRAAASDATERPFSATPHFADAIVRDAGLAAAFAQLHALVEARGETLESEEGFLRVFLQLLARHGPAATGVRAVLERSPGPEAGPIDRAIGYLEAHFAEGVDLATLAAIAGLPRTRLIRTFARRTGLTPHAWQTDRRVRAARRLLQAGIAPAEAAVECGFYDQSHLNRVFKARIGVTPGVFQGAFQAAHTQ